MSSIKDFELAQRIHIATVTLQAEIVTLRNAAVLATELAEKAESRIAALEAERDALKQDAVWLLQRARAIINRWQELYGEHQPQFLPPAHQIEWAEDASEFIDAAREKP